MDRTTLHAIIGTLFSFCLHSSYAQNSNYSPDTKMGVSVQLYPAGIIPTFNLERYLSEKTSLFLRFGFNFTDRKDFSDVNDHEEGAGAGGSFGYRKYFPLTKGKIVTGVHIDVWNLWIDWEDDVDESNALSGRTEILVLQPWLETGYYLPIKNTSSLIAITAGFGREINAITDGEEVAQDWIASLSLHYQFSLKKNSWQ